MVCLLNVSKDNSSDEILKRIAIIHKLSTVRWRPYLRLVLLFVFAPPPIGFFALFLMIPYSNENV